MSKEIRPIFEIRRKIWFFSISFDVSIEISIVIRFILFFFFTNDQRKENAKDQRDVDKNVFFFFRRRYFNANSQEKRITLDCTFSFPFFLLSLQSFFSSFFWIHRITRIRIRPRFAEKRKKKVGMGMMKRLPFLLSSYFNHFPHWPFFHQCFLFLLLCIHFSRE